MKFLANIFFTLLLFTAPAFAAEPSYPINLAPSAQLSYAAKAERSGFSLNGEAEIVWEVKGEPPDQTYSINTETRAPIFGKILEANSIGSVSQLGLSPTQYEEKRPRKPTFQVTFNRTTNQMTSSDNAEKIPLNGGEQDRTSAIWQLVSIARGSPKKFVPRSQWSFFVASRHSSEKWTFTVEKIIKLLTPLGNISTVHVTKSSEPKDDQRIDIWLAPSMEWYPVRIQFRDGDGDTIVQNLERIQKAESKL